MTVIPNDWNIYDRSQFYIARRPDLPYQTRRSLRKMIEVFRIDPMYPDLIDWSVQRVSQKDPRNYHGPVTKFCLETCAKGLKACARKLVARFKDPRLGYYLEPVAMGLPDSPHFDAWNFYKMQRQHQYRVCETLEAFAFIRFCEVCDMHPLDRQPLESSVWALDEQFRFCLDTLKILYAMDN